MCVCVCVRVCVCVLQHRTGRRDWTKYGCMVREDEDSREKSSGILPDTQIDRSLFSMHA